jgi:hypothetical protein
MNGNYQFNKFFAQERTNAHLKAARAHRQAKKANSASGPGNVRSAVSRVYLWTGWVINQTALGVKRLGKANFSARYPRLR